VWAVPGAEPPIAAGIIFGHNRARSGPDSQPRYPPICCVPFVSLHAMLITDLSLFVCGRVGASRHGGFPRGPPTPTSRYRLNRACRTARALLLTTCWLCHVPQAQISVGPAHPEFAALLKQVGGAVVPLARVGCRDTVPLQKEQSEQKLRALQRSLREVRGWLAAVAVMESLTSNSDREVQKETQVARLERETKKLRSALVREASVLVRVPGAYDNALACPPRTSSKMQTRLPKKPYPKSATWTRMVTWGRAWYVISDKPRRACCDVHGSWWLAMARGGSCAGIGELFAVPSC